MKDNQFELPTKRNVHPAKIQISWCIQTNLSKSLFGAVRVAKDSVLLHIDNKD